MSSGSTTRHTIEIFYKVTGLDQSTKGVMGFNKASTETSKSLDTTAKSVNKTDTEFKTFTKGNKNAENQVKKTGDALGKFDTGLQKTTKSTGGLADRLRGNRGLTFGMVGLTSSGIEAAGMWGMYNDAAQKVSEAQDEVNKLVDAGMEGTKEHAAAVAKTAEAQRGFNFIQRNTILSSTDMITFILLTVNALGKLDSISKVVTKTTDLFRGGLETLGLVSRGTSSNIDAFWKLQEKGPPLNTKLANSFTGIIDIFRRDLPNGTIRAGRSFTDFFGGVNTEVKKTDGVLNKSKAGFTSFFSGIGGGLKGLGGSFKTAGAAAMTFGKTLLTAMFSNPITAAIAAIGIAITALITNFGGFRDSVNQVGVAIGNAIPQLRGALTWIGEVGNSVLDTAASFLGFETNADRMAKAAAVTKLHMDPLIQALEKYLDLGPQFQNLNQIISLFANTRTEVVKLTDAILQGGQKSTVGLENVRKAFEASFGSFPTTSEKAKAAIQAVYNAIEILRKGNFDAATSQKLLTIAIDAVNKALGEEVTQTQKDIVAKNDASTAADKQAGFADLVRTKVEQLTETQKNNSKETLTSADIIAKWINQYAKGRDITDQMIISLKNAGAWTEVFGKNLIFASDGSIDFEKSLRLLRGEQNLLAATSQKTWNGIRTLVDKGKISIEEAERIVNKLADTTGVFGEGVKKEFEKFKTGAKEGNETLTELIDNAIDGGDIIVQSIEDIVKSVENWKAKTELQKRVQSEFTTDVIADNTKLAQKIQEVAMEYSKYGITSEDVFQAVQSLIKDTQKEIKKLGGEMDSINERMRKGFDVLSSGFDQISSDVTSALEEGKKAYKKFLKETNLDPDNPLILKGIVDFAVNSMNAEDDVESFVQIVADNIANMKNITVTDVQAMVDRWVTSISDEFGEDSPVTETVAGTSQKIVDTMNQIIGSGDVSGPEAFLLAIEQVLGKDKADQMAEVFGEVLTNKTSNTLAEGQGTVTQGAKTAISGLEGVFGEGVTIAGEKGESTIQMFGGKVAEGAGQISQDTKTGIRDPVVQETSLIPGEVETGISPVPGIFNQAFLDASTQAGTQLGGIVTDVHTKMSSMSTSVDTYSNSMKINFKDFVDNTVTNAGTLSTEIVDLQGTFSELSSNTATYMKSMTGNIENWMSAAVVDMEAVGNTAEKLQGTESQLSSNTKTYFNSMKTNVGSATDSMVSDLDDLIKILDKAEKAASSAADAFYDMAAAAKKAASAASKVGGAQFGGTFITTAAQHGGSFIVDRPKNINGINVGEHHKPELVTVIPLTNPNDINDKTVDFNIGGSDKNGRSNELREISSKMINSNSNGMRSMNSGGGNNMTSLPQYIEIKVVLQNGELLSRVIKPFLLKDYSAIV